ncbi:hydrolase [Hydrocarboniphaga sp.]|uniref:hydrolase n=1 Tax=Hydrocarboniphaga sp. TaxID=2033016 RepID=UPI003D121374
MSPSLAPPSETGIGRVLQSGFRPHPLLRHAHQQTIAPMLIRPTPQPAIRVERLQTPDGDFVDLGWVGEQNRDGPIAVLLHGLGGGFDSKYLRGLAMKLDALGWRAVMLQLRGAGKEPNRLPRCYHHGDTVDLRWVWQRLHAAEPYTPIAAVGWSMGGNILLRALAEEGEHCPVSVAVAASVPFRLLECAERLNRGFSRVYQRHLLSGLKDIVRRKQAFRPLPDFIDVPRVLSARSFIEFDDAFTAPLNGFGDALNYYARTSCGAVLGDIRKPTLIVHALDDPFMQRDSVPGAAALAASVTLELSEHGGHVGFIGRDGFGRPDWWLERRIADQLQAALGRDASRGPLS